ncbi:MAG: DUF1080 domain-containing protein, partial [Fibrobacteria bacterium]|nr:DUF1080 domain-containing protein [Fibrobacteria bacterium]
MLKHIIIISLFCLTSLFAEDANVLTEQEVKQGWTLIFDGTMQSVDNNWTTYVQENANIDSRPSNLIVRDADGGSWFGTVAGGGSDIRTKQKFGNFDLRFEYMIEGNSGFYYRANLFYQYIWQNCIEYAMLNELQNLYDWDLNYSGAFYDLYIPLVKNYKLFSTGEWNSVRIVAKGDSIYHYQNDELVGKIDGNSTEFKNIIKGAIDVPGTRNHKTKYTVYPCYTTEGAATWRDCSFDKPFRKTGYLGIQTSYSEKEQRYRAFKILSLDQGCKDSTYEEYSPDFMAHLQTKCITPKAKTGCMDTLYAEYDATATVHDLASCLTACKDANYVENVPSAQNHDQNLCKTLPVIRHIAHDGIRTNKLEIMITETGNHTVLLFDVQGNLLL